MGPKTTQLIAVLDEMHPLLAQYGAIDWANSIHECARRLGNSDFSGVTNLRGMYGGAGSLSDLVLQQSAGQDANSRAANDRFAELRATAWSLALEIQREATY